MNVFGIGTGELLLILLIVLLVVGPERLPQLARQWGKMVRVLSRFTRTWHEISAEINRQMNLEDLASVSPKPKPTSPPTPPAPEPDESNNIIAPPNLQQPSIPQPKDDAEVLAPAPEAAVESLPADGNLTPGAARPSDPAEPIHE